MEDAPTAICPARPERKERLLELTRLSRKAGPARAEQRGGNTSARSESPAVFFAGIAAFFVIGRSWLKPAGGEYMLHVQASGLPARHRHFSSPRMRDTAVWSNTRARQTC